MIPIRDTVPSKNHPVVTTAIISVNVVVFLYQLTLGPGIDRFIFTFGLVPSRYFVPHVSAYFSSGEQALALISYMFLHGGFWHLLGNMWSLYIFGDNVEDRLGSVRYLIFYLLCGTASGLTHLYLNPYSNIPTIGASGAIAGVMGAYFLLYPTSKILTLIPIVFIPLFFEIPSFVFLGIWFLIQFISAAGSSQASGGIAWWAHVGGFLSGMLFLKLFLLLPGTGITEQMRKVTTKKTTQRLHVLHPEKKTEDPNVYGNLSITPYEAIIGTEKMVTLPAGFQQARMFKVKVPPGVMRGTILRLSGIGKILPDGTRGDLLLTVDIL
jgi:membrane associated rhomboid family serine protease